MATDEKFECRDTGEKMVNKESEMTKGQWIILIALLSVTAVFMWSFIIYPQTLQPYDKCKEICNSSYMGKMELHLGFNKYKCETGNAEWTTGIGFKTDEDGFDEQYHEDYGRCMKR